MKTFASRGRAAGFTLIELLCAMAIAGVLSSVAYPAYQGAVHKARRADAQVALLQAQVAQERYRADHPRYGNLEDIRLPGKSPAGHYRLAMTGSDAGYEVHAVASSAQGGDADCRHLKLRVDRNSVVHASGPNDDVANAAALNRKCWGI